MKDAIDLARDALREADAALGKVVRELRCAGCVEWERLNGDDIDNDPTRSVLLCDDHHQGLQRLVRTDVNIHAQLAYTLETLENAYNGNDFGPELYAWLLETLREVQSVFAPDGSVVEDDASE